MFASFIAPHACTTPSLRNAIVWLLPQSASTYVTPAGSGGGLHSPYLFSPPHCTSTPSERIAAEIEAIGKVQVPTGVIDVSMHRDDVGQRASLPVVRASKLPLPLQGITIVIVDDVLFTGRTCRAALDAIRDFGRPASIQFAVLIDRGHRELPIRPDFVGKNLPTAQGERVRVRLEKTDNEPDAVWRVKE